MNGLTEVWERAARGLALMAERLPAILADPRAFPRETMIVALIAAVALVVTVLLAIVVYGWLADRVVRARLGVRRRRAATIGNVVLFAGTALLLLLIVASAPLIPGAGDACGACHAVGSAVDSWRAGSHASVSCYSCHARSGAAGAIEASVRGLGAVFGAGSRIPANDAECLGCHEAGISGVIESGGVRVRHADITDAGVSCFACHAGVGHASRVTSEPAKASQEEPVVIVRSVMSRCLLCHDGEKAPARCETCHVGRKPSDSSSVDGPRGDTAAPPRCDACHSPAVQQGCVDCHGLVLPHPVEFMPQHAAQSFEAPSLCAKCHEGASAAEGCACHDADTNLHGTYSRWFPLHGPAAASTGQGGCRCHQPSFCGFCHEEDPFE